MFDNVLEQCKQNNLTKKQKKQNQNANNSMITKSKNKMDAQLNLTSDYIQSEKKQQKYSIKSDLQEREYVHQFNDILDEEVGNKKKLELAKSKMAPSDLLEKEIRVSEFENEKRKKSEQQNAPLKFKQTNPNNYNDLLFMNDEEFKYPNQKKKTITKKNEYVNESMNQKKLEKELVLDFLPKDIMYGRDVSYVQSNQQIKATMDILEKSAQNNDLNDEEAQQIKSIKKSSSFWDIFNPFKCGTNDR